MPSFTGTSVADLARIYLNNTVATLYTNTVLLPIINDVLDELLQELLTIDAPVTTEVTSAYSVTAGVSSVLPTLIHARFVNPIYIKERGVGETFYTPMKEKRFLPDLASSSVLGYWTWQGDLLKFIASLVNRELQVRHTILLPNLAAIGDTINITGAKSYMATETAAVAAFAIGKNPTLAEALHGRAETAKQKLFINIAKKGQTIAFTRPGFERPRRRIC